MADPPAQASFAVLLRKLRTGARLTQEELAEAAQLSYRSISDLERGVNRTARRETARLLADALHLSGPERQAFETAARGSGPGILSLVPPLDGSMIATATRTLPRDSAAFTGREHELALLLAAMTDTAASGGVVGICAIGGMAGIGKTALAVHAAHQLAPQFPDGQIFLPLHGHTPGQQPVSPSDALSSLLETSGMAAQRIPADLESKVRLWRDRLASKRILLVLDDASGHEQVRPLLPGSAGSLVLVTSRRHLTALEDIQLISLDVLPPDDASALLVRLATRPGVTLEKAAVRQIVRMCGHLPLAVGILARQLHHHPVWTPESLVRDLAAARDRLELMQAENVSVTAAFGLSYRELTVSQQRMFRRVGLHPGTDFDAYAAAALDGTDLDSARSGLTGLYDHYLVAEPSPGRYRLHDLLAEHARDLAAADPLADRDAALDRMLDYYLHGSRNASRFFIRRTPARPTATARTAAAGTAAACVPGVSDPARAAAWMNAEYSNLHAAVIHAASSHRSSYAIDIPAGIHGYLRHHGNWAQVFTFHNAALAAARQIGNQQAEANAQTDIGDIQYLAGDHPAAITTLTAAKESHHHRGDRLGEAHALCILGAAQNNIDNGNDGDNTLNCALELYRCAGDQLGQVGALAYLGRGRLARGRYRDGLADIELAADLHGGGGGIVEAGLHHFLALAQQTVGDYAAASTNITLALELQRLLGNPNGIADALLELGRIRLVCADFAASATSLGQALDLFRNLGVMTGVGRTLYCLGRLQSLTGNYDSAAASLEEALEINRAIGRRLG
jgi:tetratricopeptide (TPR) repeat protein/transcriptional regulator with XRE-family HTH domain